MSFKKKFKQNDEVLNKIHYKVVDELTKRLEDTKIGIDYSITWFYIKNTLIKQGVTFEGSYDRYKHL